MRSAHVVKMRYDQGLNPGFFNLEQSASATELARYPNKKLTHVISIGSSAKAEYLLPGI